MRSDAQEAAEETGVAKEKVSSFGGFSKGFLLSTSSNEKKSRRKEKQTPQDSHTASLKKDTAADDEDIPFLRPQTAKTTGPVFPEVQEAMKEAYPLLDTQGRGIAW